ncbi:MAG TPA: hypothetical protein VK607_01860 [Kofleriaceae bacterium]|nr:hypothetical protein [Kofleriaceae bacterium]HMG52958.1 hypothetical protein [Kofleriaceae bacterium]
MPSTTDLAHRPSRTLRTAALAWTAFASLCSCAALWLSCGAGTRQTLLPHGGHEPPEIQDACNRAELRCSGCHPLDRVVNYQHRGQASWEQQVRRMRLKPASGITVAEADLIVKCLVYVDTLRPSVAIDPAAAKRPAAVRRPTP